MMHTLSLAGPPPHWGWRGPWHLGWQEERRKRKEGKSNQDTHANMTHRYPFRAPPTCPLPDAKQGKQGPLGSWDGVRKGEEVANSVSWEISRLRVLLKGIAG